MKNIIIKFLLLFMFIGVVTSSCETTELDLLANPLDVSTDLADAQFLFNNVQFIIIHNYMFH